MNWKSFGLTSATAASLVGYYKWKRMEQKALGLDSTPMEFSTGQVQIGGPFTLTTHLNTEFQSDTNAAKKLQLIYFGFTHCPDVCPAEMEKITKILHRLERNWPKVYADTIPLFVSCDPQRDTPKQLSQFLRDYHPKVLGLTGTLEQVKAVAKQFRVFFSVNPIANSPDDYLVDHTTIIYLMDKQGKFVKHFGRNSSIEECVEDIVGAWKR